MSHCYVVTQMYLSGKKYALNSGIEAWVQLGNLEKGGGAKMMLMGDGPG